MAIYFNNRFIEGTHQSPNPARPGLMVKRTLFSGVIGESEIRQGSKGRAIVIPIKIHSHFQTAEQLAAYIRGLDARVGEHGLLEIQRRNGVGAPAIYPFCTFEGFEKDPTPDAGPLPDLVGTLEPDGVKPSWWIDGMLYFHQLAVVEQGPNNG